MVPRKPIPENSAITPTEARTPQTMSNDPWGSEPSESAWEDVAHQREASPLGVEGVSSQSVPGGVKPGGPFASLEDEEENAWDDARKQTGGTSDLLGPREPLNTSGSRVETNPFLRKKVPQIQEGPPTESLSKITLNESSTNPWQPAIDAQNGPVAATYPPTKLPEGSIKDPWAETAPTPQLQPPPLDTSPTLISLPSEPESPAWDEEPLGRTGKTTAPPSGSMLNEFNEDQHVWDDLGGLEKGKAVVTDPPTQTAALDDWNLIDAEPSSSVSKSGAEEGEGNPALPPRRSIEQEAWKPTREPVDGKTETYQVKNVRWYDSSASPSNNSRVSPILIQNANGPCPLVALVNALTLTTPADIPDTSLVQVLRSREQISLNLLLDAVFDELMSPRRTNSEDALPDVSDLYAFLQSLHTGMNVNPRFIPTPQMVNAYKRTSLTHLHPTERGELIPGTFENTAEMSLYAAFSIPLIHGWLPPRSLPAYGALERRGASYEDVQNLLFQALELDAKADDPETTMHQDEQDLYHDILLIRHFMNTSATQLTPWGIEVIGKAIRPGTFAILFRNDHFSTLYCHPETMQLLTLVTDAGFKSHDEIVWETLADVNGERTEFLSGDFRVVGNGVVLASGSAATEFGGGEGAWNTVPYKHGNPNQFDEPPTSPAMEQEDRDLALALQLQEEEDERHRADEARRRRESILSEQYIEQQAHQPGPTNRGGQGARGGPQGRGGGVVTSGSISRGGGALRGGGVSLGGGASRGAGFPGAGRGPGGANGLVPDRRSSFIAPVTVPVTVNAQPRPPQQVIRPMIPPRRRQGVNRAADEGTDDAPPSYEQAAQDAVYDPQAGHPAHPTSSADISRQTTRASTQSGQRQGTGRGRR
ncbi:hypothetical protein G7046_g935 [Stylonectria norvegica]|nr:hypothetical protein G7046_g935 [Stylonectria norvegica]